MSIIFDIETGPDEERLQTLMQPFEPPKKPEAFDPSSVKCGNIGGPDSDKGKKKIADARAAHDLEVANYESTVKQMRIAHEAEQRDRAGLDPVVGRILAIGYFDTFTKKGEISGDDDERKIIINFWERCNQARLQQNKMIGHSIHGFDLPFLIRRSWILKIAVPEYVMTADFRFFDRMFVDLYKVWQCGTYGSERGSATLDRLARVFNDKGKQGCDGSQFARLWATDRKAAREYLVGDLRATKAVAEGVGVL